MPRTSIFPLTFRVDSLIGGAVREAAPSPLPGATWYTAQAIGDGLAYRFPAGSLAKAKYITGDFLLDGDVLAVFRLTLQEGETGPAFHLYYTALNQCQARIRLTMDALRQGRWDYEREGAWLKPRCGGDAVDPARVDRMMVQIERKGPNPVRWCMTSLTATVEQPPLLTDPLLPKGPIIDELGQSRLRDWRGKTGRASEVTARLKKQLQEAPQGRWPEGFSRWGGCKAIRFDATGFFRTHHDGKRWWLVDPDGYAYWSTGLDCVSINCDGVYGGLEKALSWMPGRQGRYKRIYSRRHGDLQFINYLTANLLRAFGPKDYRAHWATVTLAHMRRMGFNTVANWSDWKIAREAAFPYVRPLAVEFPSTPMVFRDFPDVFDPAFATDVAAYASQLEETADDPAFIGYFLMNEPTWGFAKQLPAEGMLLNTVKCRARDELVRFLREKHGSDADLSAAWGVPATFDAVASGVWTQAITEGMRRDLEAFSTIMVEKLFRMLSDACRAVDPHHLNLGARYYTVPPRWAFDGMKCFDVFSVNGYSERVREDLGPYSEEIQRPIMVGEWHFGSLDVGLAASGIGHVKDQAARGQAYRVYLEDAAAKPWCVGVHWFTLYDEAALGRFDGENWNIGFLDICNRVYEPLANAARLSHERLYDVAQGKVAPYNDRPEYLPLLFS